MKFRSSLFKGLRVKGRALAVSKGRAFGGIFKGKALKLGFLRARPLNRVVMKCLQAL